MLIDHFRVSFYEKGILLIRKAVHFYANQSHLVERKDLHPHSLHMNRTHFNGDTKIVFIDLFLSSNWVLISLQMDENMLKH